MRDVNRITPFLEEMGEIWKERFPDLRFGQLMYGFFSHLGDPFYYEEDVLMAAFRAYANNEDVKLAAKKALEESKY